MVAYQIDFLISRFGISHERAAAFVTEFGVERRALLDKVTRVLAP